jgi:hypothetical protein
VKPIEDERGPQQQVAQSAGLLERQVGSSDQGLLGAEG